MKCKAVRQHNKVNPNAVKLVEKIEKEIKNGNTLRALAFITRYKKRYGVEPVLS